MNKEGIHDTNSDTETLEKHEPAPIITESKETGQEFANKILNKIKEYMSSFTSKKEAVEKIESSVSFDDPTIKDQIKSELNIDNRLDEIDNEAQITQTVASENINLITRDFSKSYHHPDYRDKIAQEIKAARNSGQEVEAIRSEFYDKTASEKENFESQENERSVAEIMKEKDLVIIHAIPLTSLERKSTSENNPILRSGGYQDFKTSVEILSGLSPTISTSIPSSEKTQNGLYYPSGVILGEGKVLTTHSEDSGSVAYGLYKRIPKYGGGRQTAIQSKIDINKTTEEGSHYNELTVESPQVAGLFYDLSEEDSELPSENPKKNQLIENIINTSQRELSQEEIQKEIDKIDEKWKISLEEKQKERQQKKIAHKFQLNTMKKYSEEMNVPLYIFKKENNKLKKYKINFLPKETETKTLEESDYYLEEVTAKDIYESKRDISNEDRKKMIADIKNKGILSDSAEKEVNKKFQNI